MAGGRILVQGKDEGSGFALTPRVVLTANHVVRNQEALSLQFATEAGRLVPVERVERDDDRDIAVLHLGEDVSEVLMVGHAVEGAAWQVEARPRENDPQLTGTVSTTRRPFKNAQGHETHVVQLLVHQELGDYRGYSGSPVRLQSAPGAVIGVLVEQLRWRIPAQIGQPTLPASNVLYAIPIQDVLNRFGLTAVSAASPAHEARYSGPTKLAFCRQLGDSWHDLATYLDIPLYDQNRFERGDEARAIWNWLEIRREVSKLPQSLIAIGRKDLAKLFTIRE